MSYAQARGAEIAWTSWTHTANPVTTFSSGPGSEMIVGDIHLEDVAFAMRDAMGVTFPEPVSCMCELPAN